MLFVYTFDVIFELAPLLAKAAIPLMPFELLDADQYLTASHRALALTFET
jgi:hypothetical protein